MPYKTAYRDTQALAIEDRRERVLELRAQRQSWRDIAQALDVSHETARRDYMEALREAKERRLAAADVALDDEIETTEALRTAFMPMALAGDEKAAGVVLRANAQLQQLKGLTTPQPGSDKPQTLTLTWGNTIHIHQHTTDADTTRIDYGDIIDATPSIDAGLLESGAPSVEEPDSAA